MFKPILYPNGKGTVVQSNELKVERLKCRESYDAAYHANGNDLIRSILIDKIYVPEGLESETFRFNGIREGRTIDVILDEPITCPDLPDKYFHVVTFKGTGARLLGRNGDYRIHPTKWLDDNLMRFNRIWGSMNEEHAFSEAMNPCFTENNIFHTPYIAVNLLPEEIENKIYQQANEKRNNQLRLCQVVRLSQTNMRLANQSGHSDCDSNTFKKACETVGFTGEYLCDLFAREDAKICIAEKELRRLGMSFLNFGDISQNRFITGELTDLEQCNIGPFDKLARNFAYEIVSASTNFLNIHGFSTPAEKYLKKLSKYLNFDIGDGALPRDTLRMGHGALLRNINAFLADN
jgi:hypothetical protein